ncbi:MAG: immunoglobulin domain-containing protein, partial [bacterium]
MKLINSYNKAHLFTSANALLILELLFLSGLIPNTSETSVLAKDSSGRLRVAQEKAGKTWVNPTINDYEDCRDPFVLPVLGFDVHLDDDAVVAAFGRNQITMIWSNQNDVRAHFPAHLDTNPDMDWEPKEETFADDGSTFRGAVSNTAGQVTSQAATLTVNEVGGGQATIVLEAHFNNGADGFTYYDDTFRNTNQPSYASGTYLSNGGFTGGALQVTLGGIDKTDILNMSGAWQQTFVLNSSADVTISLRYNLTQTPDYDSDEFSQALLTVNGTLYGQAPNDYIAQITGNGGGGTPLTTGWQLFEINLGTLPSGNYDLVVGAYNNKKTYNTESTEILIDDIMVQAEAEGTPNTAPVATNVTITGTPELGQVLTGNYTYSDAEGDPEGTSTFRWLRDDAAIAAATAQTYTLVSADVGSVIKFEVTPVALSGVSPGTPVQSAGVGPVGGDLPPTITTHPSDQTIEEGQTATFSVVADGTPPLSYQWQKDGLDIAGATNAQYTTPPATLADDGATFRCLVSNTAGQVTSQAATLTVNEVGGGQATIVLEAHFNNGADGFTYYDDTFRNTNQPSYASGTYLSNGGFTGGALQVTLGGIDKTDILNMSGAWQQTFVLNSSADVTISLRYNLTQTPDYDSDEFSQALLTVNGTLYGQAPNDYIAQITGNGGGGTPLTTGWQLFEINLGTLPSGNYDLVVGAYNNKKTYNTESTEILIDDILVQAEAGGGPNQVTLTVNTQGPGSVTLDPAGGVYDAGTPVTLTAVADAGFEFSGWSGDLSGTANPATLTMDSDKSVTATFTELTGQSYTLTVTTAGAGSVTLEPSGGVYDAGTVVTLTAVADGGFEFSGWSGDLNGSSNPETITMDSNKSVMATFTESNGGGGDVPLPGQIIVDPNNPAWLKYYGGGPFFMCGPGDPEGFLYRGSRNADGTRNGDQMDIINKLKGTGANSIYLMAVRSHGGDAPTDPNDPENPRFQNPFVDGDPEQGLDLDILDQWETWFTEMDNNGIVIFFFFYDDQARIWNTGDNVGAEERAFIQTLVNHFEHHKHLIWVIAEEYQEVYSAARISNIAAEIRAADDHDHVIAVHKLSGLSFSEFADDPNIDQFAIQSPDTGSIHDNMIIAWNNAAGKYNLNMSESPNHGIGASARMHDWAIAMGGAYVMRIGMDIANTPVSDLEDCGRLVSFMESTNFNEMAPHDELKHGGTEYVLALPGTSYVAYASSLSADIGLTNMVSGTYNFKWYDVTNGTIVNQQNVNLPAGDQTWSRPDGIGPEMAVYITRSDALPPVPIISSFSPTAGPVGTVVTVVGSNFTGASTVAFNGTPASTFTVVSDIEINATVPSGASTGPISVTNPTGTGTSADNFLVTTPPPQQYTLTVDTVGSGSVTLEPGGGVYVEETVVTLTAVPDAGFQFSGWSGDLSGTTNPDTLTMDSDKNVTATFTALPPQQFTLTVGTVGSGSVTLEPAGGIYDDGTVVTLTALPDTGFEFTGWSGDLSGTTNPDTLTMD